MTRKSIIRHVDVATLAKQTFVHLTLAVIIIFFIIIIIIIIIGLVLIF